MSPAIDMSAFDRATDPVVRIFSADQARQLAEYRSDDTLQARIEELAEKSNEGQLTDKERASTQVTSRRISSSQCFKPEPGSCSQAA